MYSVDPFLHRLYLDDLARTGLHFLNQLGAAQHFRRHVVDGGDGLTSETLAVKVDVFSFDVDDGEDLHFGQEVERHVVHGLAKDRLLDDEDVAARLLNLLHQVQNVRPAEYQTVQLISDLLHNVSRQSQRPRNESDQPLGSRRRKDSPFFSEHSVHLRVIRDDDVVFHVGFRRREIELNEADLCLFNARYAAASGRLFVKNNSLDHLRVVDGPTQLFEDFNILEINVGGGERILDDLKDKF